LSHKEGEEEEEEEEDEVEMANKPLINQQTAAPQQ